MPSPYTCSVLRIHKKDAVHSRSPVITGKAGGKVQVRTRRQSRGRTQACRRGQQSLQISSSVASLWFPKKTLQSTAAKCCRVVAFAIICILICNKNLEIRWKIFITASASVRRTTLDLSTRSMLHAGHSLSVRCRPQKSQQCILTRN